MSAKIPETGSTPEIPVNFRYTPMEQLRTTFVCFLQGLFHYAPNGCYHWEEDENDTEIIIQDEGTVKEEVISKRPVITIVRGPMQFSTLGLDDMERYDADIDRKVKSVIVSGTMTINCCSRVSLESEKIAWISMEHIWLLRQELIGSNLLFDTGRAPQLGSPSPAGSIVADDKGDEYFVTPIMMPVQFIRQSSFMPLGKPAVQSIINRISTNIPKIRQVGPCPPGGHEYPLSLQACPPGSFYPGASDAFGKTPVPGGTPDRLPKVPHPLNPAVTVTVKQVRPFCGGLRGFRNLGPDAVPIPRTCVEESD